MPRTALVSPEAHAEVQHMEKTTRVIVAILFLISLVVVVSGYFIATSVLLHPTKRGEWREVVILSIRFINNSSNPATGGIYKLYPEGEHGLWECRTAGQEKGYFEIRIWNDGSAGRAYFSIMVDLSEYDHWEGDLADGQSVTWTTTHFNSDSYSYPGFSNFTVRTHDTSTSPWTITDEQVVSVECLSVRE